MMKNNKVVPIRKPIALTIIFTIAAVIVALFKKSGLNLSYITTLYTKPDMTFTIVLASVFNTRIPVVSVIVNVISGFVCGI